LRKNYLLLNFILFNYAIFSQQLRQPIIAGYTGLGAYSIHHIDVFSFTANQAALAQIKNSAIGVYGEKRFLLSSTNLYSAVAVLPTRQGNFGLQADYFGYKNYNESQIGLSYAKSLGSKLDIGIKFNYYSYHIPAYNNSGTLNFEIGAIAHFSEKLHAGFHVYNPVGGKLSKNENEKLASIYKLGIGYEASENFFISTEIIKEEMLPVNVDAGCQYNFIKQFFIRAGISATTANSYIGAGVSWKNFRLDISAGYHQQLGFTPGMMLLINLNKKED